MKADEQRSDPDLNPQNAFYIWGPIQYNGALLPVYEVPL